MTHDSTTISVKTKTPTSMRLTAEAKRLIKQTSEKLGVSQCGMVEMAIRRMAKDEGVK